MAYKFFFEYYVLKLIIKIDLNKCLTLRNEVIQKHVYMLPTSPDLENPFHSSGSLMPKNVSDVHLQ
jgi:hypothetical protein